ncbi:MAG TPA: fibronectin type III domain-containing protein [Patescibacteria group bacterium]
MIKGGVNIKTIIIVVILLLVGVLSVYAITFAKTYISGAAAGSDPKAVLATPDDSGKSAVVTWTTDKPTEGSVEYGTTPASLVLRAIESDQSTDHRVSLAPLKPNMTYYFRIKIGEQPYDNGGIPFSFKTKASSNDTGSDSATPTPIADNGSQVSGTNNSGNGGILLPTPGASNTGTTISGNVTGTGSSSTTTTTTCNRSTDYNGDGVINSADYYGCLSGSISTSTKATTTPVTTTPAAALPTAGATGSCLPGVDYDGNGVINNFDRIKCQLNLNGTPAVSSPSATPGL